MRLGLLPLPSLPKRPSRIKLQNSFRMPSTREAVRLCKEGMKTDALDILTQQLAVPTNVIERVIDIAPATLRRRKITGRLKSDESERVLRLQRLLHQAVDVMGSLEEARTWLKSPCRALGNVLPLEYADTEPGAREVEAVLGRIEHGIFA
jgi:putative toxin-antitoxin system antitoxin component (TIGR02293 family)